MEVDPQQEHVLTACQDRNIRIYNVQTGKSVRSFRGSQGDDGTLIKVLLKLSFYLKVSKSKQKIILSGCFRYKWKLCCYQLYR